VPCAADGYSDDDGDSGLYSDDENEDEVLGATQIAHVHEGDDRF
jgi:hypothetical protein